MNKLLYDTNEAAELLGIRRTKLFALLRDGSLKAVYLGRKTMFQPKELERFAESLTERPGGPRLGGRRRRRDVTLPEVKFLEPKEVGV